jgi:hypothetical protein
MAAPQTAHPFLDLDASVEKAVPLIGEAGAARARPLAFLETRYTSS